MPTKYYLQSKLSTYLAIHQGAYFLYKNDFFIIPVCFLLYSIAFSYGSLRVPQLSFLFKALIKCNIEQLCRLLEYSVYSLYMVLKP